MNIAKTQLHILYQSYSVNLLPTSPHIVPQTYWIVQQRKNTLYHHLSILPIFVAPQHGAEHLEQRDDLIHFEEAQLCRLRCEADATCFAQRTCVTCAEMREMMSLYKLTKGSI